MAPLTRIECITLQDEAEGYDQSLAEYVMTYTPRAAHFGTSIEKPAELWTFVDWDSPEIMESITRENNYRSLADRLAPHQEKSGYCATSHIPVDASKTFNNHANPTVEVLSMCFPGDIDDATRSAVEAQWEDFADKALRAPAMCGSITQGWTTEKDVPLPGEDKGQTGRILLALISWPSVDKHMENRDTQAFKDSVHLLRTLPSLVKLDVFHVECRTLNGQTPRR